MSRIKDNPDLPIGKSSEVKPKMIELVRKISHKSVMSICEFFMDRNEPAHLADWVIHETEGIGYASYDGGQWNGSVFCSIFVG